MVMSFREPRSNGGEPPPMTAKLGEVARYSGKVPRSVEEYRAGVNRDAWLAWSAMRRRAASHAQVRDDVSGKHFTGSLAGIVRSLHPSLPSDKTKDYTREISSFLRQTSNAFCVQRATSPSAGSSPAVWWVRSLWNDQTSAVVLTRYVSTYTENKLSPAEAGEDREPAPVETRHRDSEPSTEGTESSTVAMDPRWRSEFLRLRRSAPGGSFETVARVMARSERLDSGEVYEQTDLAHYMQINVPLRTLQDMGLLAVEKPWNRWEPMVWTTSSSQRAVMTELLAIPADRLAAEIGEVADTRALVWPVLCELTTSQGGARVEEIVSRVFVSRGRLRNTLKYLAREGWIARTTYAREATWRVVRGSAEEVPGRVAEEEPSPSQDDEHALTDLDTVDHSESAASVPQDESTLEPASDDEDDAAAIAGFVRELVDRKLSVRSAVDRAELDRVIADRDQQSDLAVTLRNELSAVTAERDQLRADLRTLHQAMGRLVEGGED
jgi:hypothetical protein